MKRKQPAECPVCKEEKELHLYWEAHWCQDCIDKKEAEIASRLSLHAARIKVAVECEDTPEIWGYDGDG